MYRNNLLLNIALLHVVKDYGFVGNGKGDLSDTEFAIQNQEK